MMSSTRMPLGVTSAALALLLSACAGGEIEQGLTPQPTAGTGGKGGSLGGGSATPMKPMP